MEATNDILQEKYDEYARTFNMFEGSPEWERAWQELAKKVGKPLTELRGWQYMGPDKTYKAHEFRLRAGVGGNNSGSNQWVRIPAIDREASTLPWCLTTGEIIFSKKMAAIATMHEMSYGGKNAMIANAELIVKAVNRFKALEEIARKTVELSDKANAANCAMGMGFAEIAYLARKVVKIMDEGAE
jgi:hypothetical protein